VYTATEREVKAASLLQRPLAEAGFRIAQERGRRAFAIEFTERVLARMKQGGPPALGLHLLLGDKAPIMAGNVLAMMKEGVLKTVALFARVV
jgi:hypothetical protein